MSAALNKDAATLRREAQEDVAVRARQDESARRTAVAQMAEHLLQPATVHSVAVHGAGNTRRSFLDPLFEPLVKTTNNAGTTLGDVLAEIETAVGKLDRFEIFRPSPTVHLSDARAADPAGAAAATDVDIAIRVAELPRFRLNTGTDIGNTEGSAYGNLLWRNIFGGAETLSLNASAGTRTRSAYSASLSAPVEGNPDVRVSLEGLASATQKPWASHEEALKGGTFRIGWRTLQGDLHSLAYGATWRQISGLAGTSASPAVRRDGGDSLKSAVTHTFVRDRRDNALLPQSGYLVRTTSELAGWGPLAGDVAFAKTEAEFAGAVSSDALLLRGVSLGLGLRGGLLYPLPFGYNVLASGGDGADPSRINDRFLLGGPTDVRGFTQGGLGPHDGGDALGGDVFAAGGVNMLVPITKAGAASPLRLQLFANSGRLVALKGISGSGSKAAEAEGSSGSSGASAGQVAKSVSAAMQELATGLPSTAVGLGLVYAHPVARFELNFSLPLVLRRGEESRKGLQVGVGINFL